MQISSYRTEILTTNVVTAKVGRYRVWLKSTKWFKIDDSSFITFDSTLIIRKRLFSIVLRSHQLPMLLATGPTVYLPMGSEPLLACIALIVLE